MDFTLPEEIESARRTLRRLVAEEVIPLQSAHGLDRDVAPPDELRRRVRLRSKALGLYGADMPVEVGGAGLSLVGRCALEMEAHFHDTVFFDDLLGGPGGPTAILLACTPEQRRRYLEPLVAGELSTCFALSEADAGSDATALRTRAVERDGHFVLDGTKSIITNGAQADFAMVFAVTDEARGARGGITCFLVDRDTPGFSVSRKHTCMGFTGWQAELVFEGCRVPASAILGEKGFGLLLALDWINANRVKLGAMAIGMTRRLLARSAEYARQRHQFGGPIAAQQGIQWKLADVATELYAAESMVLRTASMLDRGMDVRHEAAMAKLYASEMANRAAYEAIQIHGGAGCLRESGIERAYRQVRVLTIVEGTSEIQRRIIAGGILKREIW